MSPTPPPRRRALLTGLALAAPPTLYTGLTAGLSADPLLRTWLAGGLVPGRMLADPWRFVTAPLLHLDGAHLAVNGLLLAVLGAAAAVRLGPLRAVLVAIAAAAVGCLASVLHARGWAVGASGAVFGLLGALAVNVARQNRHGGVWLGLLALSLLWAVPADRAAHFGGLLGGALLALAPPPDRWVRRALAAGAALGLLGLAGLGRHLYLQRDGAGPPTAWVDRGGLAVPAAWSPGVPIPPCAAAWTDGLTTLCIASAPLAAPPPPGAVARPLPDGRIWISHGVSPAARAHHQPLLDAAYDRAVNSARPPSSAAPRR